MHNSTALRAAFCNCMPPEKRNELFDLIHITLPRILKNSLSDRERQELILAEVRGFTIIASSVMGKNVGITFNRLFFGRKCDVTPFSQKYGRSPSEEFISDYFDPIAQKYVEANGMKLGIVTDKSTKTNEVVIYTDEQIFL